MFCYFLNCRSFTSKSGNPCNILQVATSDGSVSEFFVSSTLAQALSSVQPFDYLSLGITVSRGRVSVISAESATPPDLQGG